MVISLLIQQMGQGDKIKINICPTLREPDGLAMSSRNVRLSQDEREKASTIYQVLRYVKENVGTKEPIALKKEAGDLLEAKGFKVDYVEIADAATLHPVEHWDEKKNMVILIAAFMNEVRLIDNIEVLQTKQSNS